MTRSALFALPVFLILAAPPVSAADGYTLETGHGNDSTELARIHARWDMGRKWFEAGDWHVSGYWEASLGRWFGDKRGARSLWEAGVTPVFRLQRNGTQRGMYFEGGVGGHLLSRTRLNDERGFGEAFQFGSHVGVGCTFGERGQFDLGYRLQHLSNANLASPNNGINFHQVRFTYLY